MFRVLTLASALTLSMMTFGVSNAGDKDGVYVNIGGTMITTEQDLTRTDVAGEIVDLGIQDADVTMINGRIGYRFNDYLAVEGEAGFGVSGDEFSRVVPVDVAGTIVDVNADIAIDVDDYYIAFARGILPVSEQFDIFARVGYGQATGSADVQASIAALAGLSATATLEDKADDFAYGVGAQFNFTDNDGIRADYTRLEDTDIISVAYARRF